MSDARCRRIAGSYHGMAKRLADNRMPEQARQMEREAERWENTPAAGLVLGHRVPRGMRRTSGEGAVGVPVTYDAQLFAKQVELTVVALAEAAVENTQDFLKNWVMFKRGTRDAARRAVSRAARR